MRRGVVIALLGLVAACRTTPVGPYSEPGAVVRNTSEAERLTHLASDLADGNPEQAEALLRQALTLDLYHGPAHNNLGVLFLKQRKLYDASVEFEWARKLMPGNADPRVNLAITLERAGKIGEAIDTYRAALEVAPEHMGAIEGIAMASVRRGMPEPALAGWLDEIALRGESEEWRGWARGQLIRAASRPAVAR